MNSPEHEPALPAQTYVASSQLNEALTEIRGQFLSQVDAHHSRDMILSPVRWPIPHFLCLRHRTRIDEYGLPLLGVIYDGRSSGEAFEPSVVYLCNVLDLQPLGGDIGKNEFVTLPREAFPSVDDLLVAGWIVD